MTNLAASTPHVGSVLGERYELLRHIARGGMGDVYEAEDRVLRRNVAVKVFRAASPADRARFDAEVRVLAGLGHEGLVRVFDAGPHGEDAFVVLELIDGPPLSSTFAERDRLPLDEVARLGAAVADALAYIHANGVVHRDVTPANVLCDPSGRPRLVDFGIARLLDSPRITGASLAVGTPSYMAPEQLHGGAITPAVDVYALGLVLLEALTGRKAFEGAVQETAVARLAAGPDLPSDLPPEWRRLLASMTQPEPTKRPTAEQARDRLRALAGAPGEAAVLGVDAPTQVMDTGGGTQVMPVPVPIPLVEDASFPAERRPHRSWLPVWLVAAAAAVVLVLVALAAGQEGGVEVPPVTTGTVASAESSDEQQQPAVTEPPTTMPPDTTVPETLPPETTLAPEGFPFEPEVEPPGLDGKDKDD